jgi:hypothetical protein
MALQEPWCWQLACLPAHVIHVLPFCWQQQVHVLWMLSQRALPLNKAAVARRVVVLQDSAAALVCYAGMQNICYIHMLRMAGAGCIIVVN